jgi:hypothetical protein
MRSCAHPLHLTRDDRRFLRSLRIRLWPCPGCEPETAPDVETDGE